MRFLPRAILAGGTGFAVSLLAACGGGGNGLLSGNQASELQSRLDQISAAVAARNCRAADRGARRLANAVINLPTTVNVTLRNGLARGASTVAALAGSECQLPATTSTGTTSSTKTKTTATTKSTTASTSTTSTTSATPTSPPTTPTTVTTTPTTPTTPTTTPTTPTNPSGGGGLGGGGSGGGKGKHD